MRLKNLILMATFFSLCLMTKSYGQGWEKYYQNDTLRGEAKTVARTSDNGFIISSREYLHNNTPRMNNELIKTDVNGDTLWIKKLDFTNNPNNVSNPISFSCIEQTTDGGYILGGVVSGSGTYLVKTDASGDTLWTKTYGIGSSYGLAIEQTADGGYILASNHVIKTDANGVVLWTKNYGYSGTAYASSLDQTTDGGYIITGIIQGAAGLGTPVYLVKTDAIGDTVWTQRYSLTVVGHNYGYEVQETSDGGYILGSMNGLSEAELTKVDGQGIVQWSQVYANTYDVKSLLQTNDGGYILVGNLDNRNNYILKTNNIGTVIWNREITHLSQVNRLRSYFVDAVVAGDGYAILGHQDALTYQNINHNDYNESIFLLRTDSLGQTITNNIKGNIFNDTSFDCLKDSGERNFEEVVVTAVGSNRTWYGTTDSLGNYCILVDTGSYVVTVDEPVYWQACANDVPVTITTVYTNDTIDFPLQAQVNCSMMEVDLAAPFIRRAGPGSAYMVNYCNNGTIDEINASVEVTIDADLDILSTSLPIASQVGNTLTFNIGNVNYGDCDHFTIQVRAKTTSLLGQTHCSQAHIFPDSLCLPAWTGGVIEPSVNCQNDSVAFRLENIGSGVFNSETYYVFEDHVIMRTGNTGNISSGGSFNLTMAADTGKTYRMSVPQNVGYPALLGDSIASVAIEGCVPYLTGAFNTGFITQFPNGNSAPSIAVDCQANRGSYDPNDKAAQPKGYDAQHYIYSYTDLDYKIRFQNTGTDTAFLVVIRDTISPLLDLSTLTMGASSHNYTWRVYGERVLEITYENILLPDSTTNEPASNGFVRYRIEQTTGNVVGDVIYNGADIYFDFNAPIQTNQTFHTIGENFVTIISSQSTILDELVEVKVYPNPFTQNATLEVEGKDYNELQLTLYDVSGRTVLETQAYSNNRIELSRGNLQPGIYFYQLLGDDALINTGKLIVQ
ncbi:MAG: Unknown protein [uncultured Aureispira sp.]|uniref:Uncharacterized protein n=1 Tax=uncultured Aureispira sp. TaxID=1331704 RepID=A0A6S6T9I0_9BACT|nr:MAG: Unknown protein [uncultured Aureispira sp.]